MLKLGKDCVRIMRAFLQASMLYHYRKTVRLLGGLRMSGPGLRFRAVMFRGLLGRVSASHVSQGPHREDSLQVLGLLVA